MTTRRNLLKGMAVAPAAAVPAVSALAEETLEERLDRTHAEFKAALDEWCERRKQEDAE